VNDYRFSKHLWMHISVFLKVGMGVSYVHGQTCIEFRFCGTHGNNTGPESMETHLVICSHNFRNVEHFKFVLKF